MGAILLHIILLAHNQLHKFEEKKSNMWIVVCCSVGACTRVSVCVCNYANVTNSARHKVTFHLHSSMWFSVASFLNFSMLCAPCYQHDRLRIFGIIQKAEPQAMKSIPWLLCNNEWKYQVPVLYSLTVNCLEEY